MDNTEFIYRVLSDERLGKVEALYLFSQTEHNQYSVLDFATESFENGGIEQVVILGSDPVSAYPGSQLWRTILMTRGIPPELVLETEGKGLDEVNTYKEAQLFVDFCVKYELTNVAITAAPFHQERAYISTVSAALKAGANLKIHSYLGKALAWNQQSVHSQGLQKGTRLEILKTEQEKIEKYFKKGDLLSRKEILEYMNNR